MYELAKDFLQVYPRLYRVGGRSFRG